MLFCKGLVNSLKGKQLYYHLLLKLFQTFCGTHKKDTLYVF